MREDMFSFMFRFILRNAAGGPSPPGTTSAGQRELRTFPETLLSSFFSLLSFLVSLLSSLFSLLTSLFSLLSSLPRSDVL